MIGNEAEFKFQTIAMKEICGITQVKPYDIELKANLKEQRDSNNKGKSIFTCNSAKEVIKGAQIITTCTADKHFAIILFDNMIVSEVDINAIGEVFLEKRNCVGTFYCVSRFLQNIEKICIKGELQQPDQDHLVTELQEVIAGYAAKRTTFQQIKLFDSVGFAIEHF